MLRTAVPRLTLLGALALAVALGGCGRKGPLDPPPRASAQPAGQQQAAEQPADPAVRQAQSGWPLGQPDAPDDLTAHTPPGQKKPFFLDWLLN